MSVVYSCGEYGIEDRNWKVERINLTIPWTGMVPRRGRSNVPRLAQSGKSQKWVGCTITMNGKRRDDMCTNLPICGCYGFSGPTRSCPTLQVIWTSTVG